MRLARVAVALLLLSPVQAAADWQIQPFLGVTFGGGTTFVDLEHAAGDPNVVFGVAVVRLGEVFGFGADVGHAPGFFQSGDQHKVARSSTTTLTGDIVIALPRRLTEYTLRPYFAGGAGLMHVRINDPTRVFDIARTLAAIDVGGGVTGFLSEQIGVNWDVRRFRNVGGKPLATGLTFDAERLSFWRVNMSVVIRY